MIKKNSKKKISSNRLVPKYTRGASWLTLQVSFILALSVIVKDVEAQEEVYVTPDVNIFEYQEQVFELPGSGDYISREQVSKYNFKNINDIDDRIYTCIGNGLKTERLETLLFQEENPFNRAIRDRNPFIRLIPFNSTQNKYDITKMKLIKSGHQWWK